MTRIEEVKLAPSILAADFARLGQQVVEASEPERIASTST
jgi:pentose-5-phosphate-3-epimerase